MINPFDANVSVCPACGQPPSKPHCRSATCTWLLCDKCSIDFTADGYHQKKAKVAWP